MNLNKLFRFAFLCVAVFAATKTLAAPPSNTSDLSWLLMQLKKLLNLHADYQQLLTAAADQQSQFLSVDCLTQSGQLDNYIITFSHFMFGGVAI